MTKSVNETLLDAPMKVVNVGLESFARELTRNGAEVVPVDWTPPAGGARGGAGLSDHADRTP